VDGRRRDIDENDRPANGLTRGGGKDGVRGPDGGDARLGYAEQSQVNETEKRWMCNSEKAQLRRLGPLFEDTRGGKESGELGGTKADKQE
jgi:hypothetical protein